MTETTEIFYAGSSVFIDFPIDGGVLPVGMVCEAKLLNKDNTVAGTYSTTRNDVSGAFELRIPYTDTTMFSGSLHTLLVRVTDTTTNYSDIIYDRKISWK